MATSSATDNEGLRVTPLPLLALSRLALITDSRTISHNKTNMVSIKYSLLAAIFGSSVLAADCYPSNKPDGLTLAQYRQVANQVCNSGPSASVVFDYGSWPSYTKKVIEANYSGNAKVHCKEAFDNIISQCVSGNNKNGGSWTWNYNGVNEKYYIQGYQSS
ncbi:hypothetical protein CH63R_14220 [Colletotrichum higginsianum IMI 349063]|uniref:Uncharacterized protein n=2 Tax=Colletotrichum higginsianum (strain IMI 349063) TaxID=759273 RepID=A0A1B7XTE3_COLHI|nr:hypothetical protein CH63R_14220 [Colletotrichum higginsianum IMI 349063]OBR02994.1 hypothetical protein CH63R_14220 [Colletotrichum higginsianum IMI 349063]